MAAHPDFTEAVIEALQRRGRTIVRVHGRSMYPTLRHGTRVEVQPVAYDELAVGDVIVFYDGRGIVCHRLLRKTNRLCYCKGDTNLFADPPVLWTQVLGRVSRMVDDECRILSLDTPTHRRRARLLARFSYPYSTYFNLLRYLGGCRWWRRGVELDDRR